MMVGRLVSFWEGLFLGAMLNFRGVFKIRVTLIRIGFIKYRTWFILCRLLRFFTWRILIYNLYIRVYWFWYDFQKTLFGATRVHHESKQCSGMVERHTRNQLMAWSLHRSVGSTWVSATGTQHESTAQPSYHRWSGWSPQFQRTNKNLRHQFAAYTLLVDFDPYTLISDQESSSSSSSSSSSWYQPTNLNFQWIIFLLLHLPSSKR